MRWGSELAWSKRAPGDREKSLSEYCRVRYQCGFGGFEVDLEFLGFRVVFDVQVLKIRVLERIVHNSRAAARGRVLHDRHAREFGPHAIRHLASEMVSEIRQGCIVVSSME